MTRITDIEATSMLPEARAIFDKIATGPRGTVEGPLRVWLHRPRLADLSQELGAYCRYETRLPPLLSELAILVVGAHWRAGFEWFVHSPIARNAGLGADAIEAIRIGRRPDLATEAERAVFDFSHTLVTTRRIPSEMFERCREILGDETLVDLNGLLGYYTYISMTIVAFDIDVPGQDPFGEVAASASKQSEFGKDKQ